MSSKTKKTKGSGGAPIKWFALQAEKTQDIDKIRAAAEAEKYSDNTISIQIGRLRAAGLLPPKEKAEKKPSAKAEGKGRKVRAVPKPSQAKAAVAAA